MKKPKIPYDRASWRRGGKEEINIAMLAILDRKGVAPKDESCEYMPICHVYCLRKDAQSCSQYQQYVDIQLGKVPDEYSEKSVLQLT